MHRLIERLLLLPRDKLVRVKSWKPARGRYGIEWPTMLIDRGGHRRMTITPIWNWSMVRGVFTSHEE